MQDRDAFFVGGRWQPAATEERTPTSKAVPGAPRPANQSAKLSEEDLGMIKELLVAGATNRARGWESPTRMYLT